MKRILVAGSTGAGKTTLARAVARRRAIPFHEMDALAIVGPDWRENQELLEDVSHISSGPCWVFDSFGHPAVRDLLWDRADTIVWLDYSRAVVIRRVLRRSVARTLFRRRIFGGNVETVRSWFSVEHPVRWAWSQYAGRRADIADRCADEQFAPLDVIHLRTPRAARAWLDTVGAADRPR
ncbi:AAA family ATPase [Streptomyces sp. NPDC058466]|uniref:AAA family ATPase n=1 Tax=Streptomyces sp. NPDC058466 TaxID=3346512 RepID=UPI0036574A84